MTDTTTTRRYENWIGQDAYGRDGEKIGSIDNIFYDEETGRPEWLTIKTGFMGLGSSFAPITGSRRHDDGLKLDVTKDQVKDAPDVGDGNHLPEDDERRLYEHYSIPMDATGRERYTHDSRRDAGYDTSTRADEGYEVDQAAVTRHEEELRAGTRTEETGKVRLRKYVTTEHETMTVPVEKERVVVERTDVDGRGDNAPVDAGEGRIGEEVAEVPVREEKVVSEKDTVAKEQVRVGKQTQTEQKTVEGDVRREHVDVEGDNDIDLVEDSTKR